MYELCLVLLRMSPRKFWHYTPSETADLILAFRKRENRRAMQRAWELSLKASLTPYMSDEGRAQLTTQKLFKAMPMAYPADMPPESFTEEASDITSEQAAELERRRKLPRMNRLRK